MKLNSDFRENLAERLKLNKLLFGEQCLKMLSDSINTPFRTMLVEISGKDIPFEIDFNSCVNSILNAIHDESNPEFRLRIEYTDRLDENEIEFKCVYPRPPAYNTSAYSEFRNSQDDFENACEEEFWLIPGNRAAYEKLSQFPPFNNVVIPVQHSYKVDIFNIEGWQNYIEELIKHFFRDFTTCTKVDGKVTRFTKDIAPGLILGIEFNVRYFLHRLKERDPDISYLNIMLYNSSFNLSAKTMPYIFKYNDKVLSLGILGNPFFYGPCFSLSLYSLREMYYFEKGEGTLSMLPRYFWEKEIYDDGTFAYIHPEVYGEKLKKHAFFYMAALAYSSGIYLDYVEKSILDSL